MARLGPSIIHSTDTIRYNTITIHRFGKITVFIAMVNSFTILHAQEKGPRAGNDSVEPLKGTPRIYTDYVLYSANTCGFRHLS